MALLFVVWRIKHLLYSRIDVPVSMLFPVFVSCLGPLIQSIISFTKSLAEDSLNPLVHTKSSAVIIFLLTKFKELLHSQFFAPKWQ